MKVILLKELDNVGEADTLVNVSDGYARNYLLPRKLAAPATAKSIAVMEQRQAERQAQMEARRGELEAQAKKLNGLEVTIAADAGEGGKLFGSVTAQEIAEEAGKLSGIELSKKKIALREPIKLVGEYDVPVKLYQEIGATLKVKVTAR